MALEPQQARVQEIARATLGWSIYLNYCPMGYYWCDEPQSKDPDKSDALYDNTPLDALKGLLEACDFLKDTDGSTLIRVYR